MATQTHAQKFGHSVEISVGGFRRFLMWAAVFAAVAALTVGVILLATRPMPATRFDSRRALAADTARQNGLAGFYLGESRAISAEAARLTANAEAYFAAQASRQRAMTADAARYTTLAEYHQMTQQMAAQRTGMADAARYTTLAEFYRRERQATQMSQKAFGADLANLEAMAGRKAAGFATLAEYNASLRSAGSQSMMRTMGR